MNVLLITIDTLRADHLGCYGYARNTSPNIDRLAADGVLAERFFCAGIPTQPSYTTMYTGQH
ncbi:MAG: sulfatase-like hydrolase/transferase, partial [Chloroflexota bacterium]